MIEKDDQGQKKSASIPPTELAYAAGIIDGEGCITITKSVTKYIKRRCLNPQYQLRIAVVMADPEVCKWLNKRWPGCLKILNPAKYNPKAKPTFNWSISAQKAKFFLEQIYPFLKIKKRQALIGIEFQKNCIQRAGKRIRDKKGRFTQGTNLQNSRTIAKKESLKSLISIFNQHGCIWSGALEGIPKSENYYKFLKKGRLSKNGKYN